MGAFVWTVKVFRWVFGWAEDSAYLSIPGWRQVAGKLWVRRAS